MPQIQLVSLRLNHRLNHRRLLLPNPRINHLRALLANQIRDQPVSHRLSLLQFQVGSQHIILPVLLLTKRILPDRLFGIKDAFVWAVCVRINALVMELVSITTIANVILDWMVSLNGLVLIALRELALRIMLGLVMLSMPMMLILGQSAPIKVFAIVPLEHATALQVMKVLLVKEPFAQIIAMIVVLAGQKKYWLPKRTEHILLLGTP
mmetsp:Transcript_12454/g.9051  ORF Transcript_12454/g.9051 Transcript_12454/m.9051 type:complete len:208 (-) Transcript_12454:275-898(-)